MRLAKGWRQEENNFKIFLFVRCVDPFKPPVHFSNVIISQMDYRLSSWQNY